MESPPREVRFGIVGEASVGKTSLINRYVKDEYANDQDSSIGVTMLSKTIHVATQNVTVSIADTAGQEVYHSLASVYLRSADVIFLCFDPKAPNFEEGLARWFNVVNEVSDAVKYLVLTKRDQWGTGAADYTSVVDGEALCRKYQAKALLVTSAMWGDGVNEAFYNAAEQFLTNGKAVVSRKDPEPRQDKDNCC